MMAAPRAAAQSSNATRRGSDIGTPSGNWCEGDGIRSRFLLVVDDDADLSTNEAAKQLAGSFDDIVELRSGPRQVVTLVRPDGYIAYSAHGHDGIVALKSVRSLLEGQTN
jgi:hypothetical protein